MSESDSEVENARAVVAQEVVERGQTRLGKMVARALPRNGFGFNVVVLAGGMAISQGLLLVTSPLLTRLYTSSDFGYLQVYLSISVFFTVVASLRYETAVLLPDDAEAAANLVAFALCVTVVMFVLFSGAVWLLSRSGILGSYAAGLRPYLWLIPISACGSGAYQILNSWALRNKAFRKATLAKITQAASQAVTQLTLGGMHAGVPGLLFGEALGRMGGSLRLARDAWKQNADLFRRVRFGKMWSVAQRYKRFPLISSGSSLINTGGFALPALLIGGWYGPFVLGWFALTDRVLAVPTALMGQSISSVYTASAARLINSDPAGLRTFFLKTAWHCFLLGFVPFLGLA